MLPATQFSEEAERQVLGSLLVEDVLLDRVLDRVKNILSPDDFSNEGNSAIYKTMLSINKKGDPVDLVNVNVITGRREYLMNIMANSIPTNLDYYVKIVKIKSLNRKAKVIGMEIEQLADEGKLEEAKKKSIELDKLTFRNDVTFSDLFTPEDFERISKSKRFYSDHLKILTHRIPFIRGECIYIAGRTSTGKTQMAINLTLDFLLQGAKVGYISLEMGKEQMMIRLLNWEFGSKATSIYDIDIRKQDWWDMGKELLKQKKFKNFYFYQSSSDFSDIISWIDSHDFDVVFIDYIQLLRDKDYSRLGRNAEIGAIARRIRQEISKKRCAVVMSQMNRTKPDESDLSQIRDSGEIEQTSTSVIFIDRVEEGESFNFKYKIMKNQTYSTLSGWIPLEFLKSGEFKEEA